MPIVNPGPSAPVVEQPVPIQIAPPTFKGVTVDTREQPVSGLLTHVEGQSWTIDWYSQVVDTDNDLSGQQPNREMEYQQYIKVKSLELKVTSPLSATQDQVTKEFNTTGTATMYPGVVPNAGDMFLADVGDGRESVFEVTNSTRMSILKKTTYVIEYKLIDYSENRLADLNGKVIKTVHFVRDYAVFGNNPLVEEEDFYVMHQLADRYYDVVDDYMKSFFSAEKGTFILPGQEAYIYDAFLVNALVQFFNTRESPIFMKMRQLNVSGDDVMKSVTLWDALMRRQKRDVAFCAQEMGLITIANFRSQGMLEGIYFSGIEFVVYPKNPDLSVDDRIAQKNIVLSERQLKHTGTRATTFADAMPNYILDGLPSYGSLLFKLVTVDDYYILSEDFYKKTTNQSTLELLVWDYLEGRVINNRFLLALVENYRAMGGLERFYYTPIILLLIKASLRSI